MYQMGYDDPTVFQLDHKKYLHTCLSAERGDNCELFVILERQTNRKLCNCCTNKKRYVVKRQKRIEKSGDRRTLSDSKARTTYMSPSSLERKTKNMKKKMRALVRSNDRCKIKLKIAKESQTITFETDKIPEVLMEAFQLINSREIKEKLEERILQALLTSKLQANGEDYCEEELQEYASTVCHMMNDECKKVAGKEKQVRFDS